MLIIDGDYPMALAVKLNRDLKRPIDEVRNARQIGQGNSRSADSGTMASLPEMRRASVAAALVKVAVDIDHPGSPIQGGPRTRELAYATGMGQLALYRVLEAQGEARILRTRNDMTSHMREWAATDKHDDLPVGFILGIEGTDPIAWPEQVHEWYEYGMRVISIGHYGVATYGHGTGTGTEGGLLPEGPALLREMDGLGMILDVTHTSDTTVRESLEIFQGPILASHQNCRALVPGERQQPDDILKAVIDRGGVIGASMDTWMLTKDVHKDWSMSKPESRRDFFPRDAITLEDVVDHIDYVCQLAGNSQHAAIGGDTDGQGGAEGAPADVDTIADYQKIAGILERRGYKDEDVASIMHGNWQRFFETHLPE